jgi:protein ImuB
MLWVALFLPELSLQLARRGVPDGSPLVVSDGPGNRPTVVAANAAAREAGVAPGMALAAAQALAGNLQVMPRDPAREEAALDNLAGWAGQFTPKVVIEPHAGVLLEVAGSLKLFGGLAQLLTRIREGARRLGYRAVSGVAPTPLAAYWLARVRVALPGVRSCTEPAYLAERLADLPLDLLGWQAETVALLRELGIKRLKDCLALPRDGLARRFGPELVALLDRALGLRPDPRPAYVPPERFASRIELPAEIEHVEGLLFPLRRLLHELEGFLCGRGAGVQQLALVAEHTRHGRSRLTLGLTAPERNSARLLALLHEQLMRVQFPGAVVAIGLHADILLPYTPQNTSFLPDAATQTTHWRHLAERLRARLGEERVFALQALDDHRPEHAWRVRHAFLRRGEGQGVRGGCNSSTAPSPRPLWLLTAPKALASREDRPEYRGPLALLAGPERIEAGWWDGRRVGRDYYVARTRRGELVWVYREHRMLPAWYLQGIFA